MLISLLISITHSRRVLISDIVQKWSISMLLFWLLRTDELQHYSVPKVSSCLTKIPLTHKTKETCNIPKHSLKIQRKKIQKKLIQTRNHDRWPDWEAKRLWRNYYDGIFSWTTSSTCMSKIKVTGTFYLLLVIWYHVKGLWVKTDFSFRYILLILTKMVTFKGNHKYHLYLKKNKTKNGDTR